MKARLSCWPAQFRRHSAVSFQSAPGMGRGSPPLPEQRLATSGNVWHSWEAGRSQSPTDRRPCSPAHDGPTTPTHGLSVTIAAARGARNYASSATGPLERPRPASRTRRRLRSEWAFFCAGACTGAGRR